MSSFTIGSSDQEILNALNIVESISKEFASTSSFKNSCNIFYKSGNSERTSSLTTAANDFSHLKRTFDHGKEVCDSFKLDREFHTVSQGIQTVYLMDDLFIERKNALENETKTFINELESASEEMLSESILNKKLESIKLVVKHILQIENQMSRIKEVLQVDPGKSTLKVSPFCQKDAVQFFDNADVIIKKMLEDADAIEFSETNFTKVIPINEMALHSKIQSIITGLARRLDIITDFRNSLLTTKELESGKGLRISKSGPPSGFFGQISTTDSGLSSSLNPE